MLYCTVFAQTGAVLAVTIKAKSAKMKTIATSATLSGFVGITEPAIYGATLPKKEPFIIASIAPEFGGAAAGFLHAKMYGGFATAAFWVFRCF